MPIMADTDQAAPGDSLLTSREIEVVRHLVAGYSNKEIALSMGITARTVQAHIAHAAGKTNSRNRTHLAIYAVRANLAMCD